MQNMTKGVVCHLGPDRHKLEGRSPKISRIRRFFLQPALNTYIWNNLERNLCIKALLASVSLGPLVDGLNRVDNFADAGGEGALPTARDAKTY
jgi:hypothetical protein